MKRILFAVAALMMCAASSWATLSPSQLTAQERATYNKLSPTAKSSFLATREYVRICKATTKANAASLPDIPSNYDATYVTAAEQTVVDHALDLSFASMLDGTAQA